MKKNSGVFLDATAFFINLASPVNSDGYQECAAALALGWEEAARLAYDHCFYESRTLDLQKAILQNESGTIRMVMIRDPRTRSHATIISAPIFAIYGFGLMSLIAANEIGRERND